MHAHNHVSNPIRAGVHKAFVLQFNCCVNDTTPMFCAHLSRSLDTVVVSKLPETVHHRRMKNESKPTNSLQKAIVYAFTNTFIDLKLFCGFSFSIFSFKKASSNYNIIQCFPKLFVFILKLATASNKVKSFSIFAEKKQIVFLLHHNTFSTLYSSDCFVYIARTVR